MNWYAYCAAGPDHPADPRRAHRRDVAAHAGSRPSRTSPIRRPSSRQGGEGGVWAYYTWKVSQDL